MNKDVSDESIKKVITSIAGVFQEELFACSEQDLEKYWYFKFAPKLPLSSIVYDFFCNLELYRGFCRRWEEYTNGSCCVVERVRDKYLIPKIKEFILLLAHKHEVTGDQCPYCLRPIDDCECCDADVSPDMGDQ